MEEENYPTCIVCNEEPATIVAGKRPDGSTVYLRCRDCDIDYLIEMASCEECKKFIFAKELSPNSHANNCSKRSPPCSSCGGEKKHAPGCKKAFSKGLRL